jgi:hypothetical protein
MNFFHCGENPLCGKNWLHRLWPKILTPFAGKFYNNELLFAQHGQPFSKCCKYFSHCRHFQRWNGPIYHEKSNNKNVVYPLNNQSASFSSQTNHISVKDEEQRATSHCGHFE